MPHKERGRTVMGAKGEAFAKQFEAKVEEATALLEKLTDADWKKTTAAEKWTVAVTAHHIASSYESATHIITTIAAGQELPHFNREMLDDVNAQHAKEFAGCTKAETIAVHKKAAASAAAAVRGLSDGELAKTGTVFTGMPPVSVEELVKLILLGHVDAHFGSIRKTVGG
jgi:Mycothiol maleylpyruvate isomerase N-terminal domain